jgi:creatinine amidohydrolase
VEAGEGLLKECGLQLAVACVLDLAKQTQDLLECPGDSHAGELETSLALHLWPGLVKGSAPEEYPSFPPFLLSRDKLGHWPGGVWGNPGLASAQKGGRILAAEAQALARILAALDQASRESAG